MRTWRAYTFEEIKFLRENYSSITPAEAAAHLSCSISRVHSLAHKLGLRSKRQQGAASAVHNYFTELDTCEKAYILGLLTADGCVMKNNVISLELTEDKALVEFVRDRLALRKNINISTAKSGKTKYKFSISSNQMKQDLAKYGVIPRKTGRELWPSLDRRLSWSFLHGYFDGDGCLSRRTEGKREWTWTLCCASKKFLENVLMFIRQETDITCGRVSPTIHEKTGNACWHFSVSGQRNILLLDDLIQSDHLGLRRKKLSVKDRRELLQKIQQDEIRQAEISSTRNKIIALFEEGKTTKEIMTLTGRGGSTVRRIRRESDLPVPPVPKTVPWNKGKKTPKTPSAMEIRRIKIAELIEENYSDTKISQITGCNRKTVWNIRQRVAAGKSLKHGGNASDTSR